MNEQDYKSLKENAVHGDYTFPYIWYYTSLPDYYTDFPVHWHDEMEIINVFDGEMIININLTTHLVRAGEIAIIKPGELHGFTQSGSSKCQFLSLLFNKDLLDNSLVDSTAGRYLKPFFENEISCPSIINSHMPGYEKLLANLDESFNIQDKKQPFYELQLKANLFNFFYLLLNNVCTVNHVQDHVKKITSRNIKSILDYINEHYQESITISDLAQLLGFSDHYFMRFFKNNLGITCVEYINECRLNAAIKLLRETDLSISEIAVKVGIPNISYFNRMFKKKFKMTPKDFRFQNS